MGRLYIKRNKLRQSKNNDLDQQIIRSKSAVDLVVMNMIVVILAGFSVVATLVIGILGCLLSRCKNKSSYDTVMGGKTEVEKEEYGLLVVDGGGETCNCNTGFIAMTWTILEVLVTGVLAVVIIIMVTKNIEHYFLVFLSLQ